MAETRSRRAKAGRSSAQAAGNRALATGTPERNLKAAAPLSPPLRSPPGTQGKGSNEQDPAKRNSQSSARGRPECLR
ncbi:hypothetical protein H8959_019406 [Pygathrix nigripes]